MSLRDKTVLVTGGGTGIGAGCALALAEAGARVLIAGRREDKLRETAGQFKGSPAIEWHVADVSELDQTKALVEAATKKLGRIDILLNSAGVNIAQRRMEVLDPADWEKLLKINTTGTFYAMHAVLPQMRERKDGLIINISSVAGIRALPLAGAAYAASKFAVTALGTCTAQEERQNGIRITNVYPGEVETPILDARPVPVSAEHRARILQPSDIASIVVAIAHLPPRANVSDVVIKPTTQEFV